MTALPRERLGILERLVGLRRVPFVTALETLPEIAARFRRLHLGADVSALRTLLGDGLVPRHEIAILIRARVERGAALARATLHQLAAVLRTEDAGRHGARAATLRERATAQELAASPLT